jgi:TetR/AcrR family transcriptional repressor of mexJK operon
MDSQATTKNSRDDRRTAILKIARAAFLRDGYSSTSMSQIRDKVGGSKATLYNHFPSKKDLFVAVCAEEASRTLTPLFDVGEMRGDIFTVLEKFIQRSLVLFLSDDLISFYRLIVAESPRVPEIAQMAYEVGIQPGLQRMAAYFSAAIDRGELRHTDLSFATWQFLDLCVGNLHRRRLWGIVRSVSRADIDIYAKRAAATFLAAYGNDALSRRARESLANTTEIGRSARKVKKA